jgi:hypothetical protein
MHIYTYGGAEPAKGKVVSKMEKVCCEIKCGEDFEMKCVEIDDGYRIEIKGDKERIKGRFPGFCCGSFGGAHSGHSGGCCC